ncbi:MAG: 4Fe-4S binding protein [Planctomycetaceae bacterium]|jgi:[FeFe] hydrogenase (group B1/B3)|nr:4Fe-4S binding protein [Planctomycetaceae bacterium]
MNNAERTRRQLMIRFIQDFFAGVLEETIDRIPVEMRPRNFQANRCCVYKDRAMLRYRLMALMGFGMEEELDESRSLRSYFLEAVAGRNNTQPILTVCTVGCAGCVESHVQVSDGCVGCFARPCVSACPKKAIAVINQRSTIDRSKCIDCGRCMNVCPYKAIIRKPLPCEDACPVGAIGKGDDERVRIDFGSCIYCGKCFRACPFSTIMIRSELVGILQALKENKRVIAMIAPSITEQFPGSIEQLFAALKQAGFAEIIEVALGAEETTKHEAEEFFERMARGDKVMTSSCCPAWVEAAKKHVPEILPMVSETPSPMAFTGQIAAERYPDAVKVFIGPCLAKRKEAQNNPNIDFVITFEILGSILAAKQIDIKSIEAEPLKNPAASYARNFAKSCGVTAAIIHQIGEENNNENNDSNNNDSNNNENGNEQNKNNELRKMLDEKFINGLDRKSLALLKMYAKGGQSGNFLEVMACNGGCIGGPCSLAK